MLKVSRTQKTFFIIMCALGFFTILSSTLSKNPVLKPFATSLGTPNELLGIIASASTIPGILVSLPAASLSDVCGRRKVLLFSAFVFASAPFLYFYVNSWWTLALVRFYHGFATAIFIPVAEASIAQLYPTKRGERISLFNSAMATGRGIAPFLGGYILFATSQSYFLLYLAVGVAGVTALGIALLFLAERRINKSVQIPGKHVSGIIFSNWLCLVRNSSVLGISYVQAVQYAVFGSVEFFLVGYLVDIVGLDLFSVGIIAGSQIVALIITRPIIGRISDRMDRSIPIIIGVVFSCFFVGAVSFTTAFPLLILLAIGYGISFAAVTSSTTPTMSEVVPVSMVGASFGFLATMMDIGQTLGPILSGILLVTINYQGLFISLSGILVTSIVVFVVSKSRVKNRLAN